MPRSARHTSLLFGMVLSAAAAVAGCASTSPRDRDDARLAEYRAVAGEPVRSFRYFNLMSWEPLGDAALAVRTRPGEAWLLELAGPCQDLVYVRNIGLTSSAGTVSARFDRVITGRSNIPCHIETIRPVDLRALREHERDERSIEMRERPTEWGDDAGT
ncbi:DUF6491 family protein [Coralloluteibacterium thermophilus]|uniref:DUF6491 family protein n=1 Tax=Coralloluteibacterium thermophilum TaxID=2707049 RepID=A0ABV9NMT6_9GAMM